MALENLNIDDLVWAFGDSGGSGKMRQMNGGEVISSLKKKK
jgi:hypothetical protein